MTALLQRSLPLRVQIRLPMMDIAGVRGALGVSEHEVLELIEQGSGLSWAWDISTRAAQRREVRVLARCVTDLQRDAVTELSFDDVVSIIFGRSRPFLWGKEIFRAFNCTSDHVMNLVVEDSLQRLPDTDWRRGPGGSPCVAWASAVQFLKQRRLP